MLLRRLLEMEELREFCFLIGFAVAFVVFCSLMFHISGRVDRKRVAEAKEKMGFRTLSEASLPRVNGIHVVEIDGHEYIYFVNGAKGSVCHKADCQKCVKGGDE